MQETNKNTFSSFFLNPENSVNTFYEQGQNGPNHVSSRDKTGHKRIALCSCGVVLYPGVWNMICETRTPSWIYSCLLSNSDAVTLFL